MSPPIRPMRAASHRKMASNGPVLHAQRLQHADLPGPFDHGHGHDVHYPDAGHHQGYAPYADEEEVDGGEDPGHQVVHALREETRTWSGTASWIAAVASSMVALIVLQLHQDQGTVGGLVELGRPVDGDVHARIGQSSGAQRTDFPEHSHDAAVVLDGAWVVGRLSHQGQFGLLSDLNEHRAVLRGIVHVGPQDHRVLGRR